MTPSSNESTPDTNRRFAAFAASRPAASASDSDTFMAILDVAALLVSHQNPLTTIADLALLYGQKLALDRGQKFSFTTLMTSGQMRPLADALTRTITLLDTALNDPRVGPELQPLLARLDGVL